MTFNNEVFNIGPTSQTTPAIYTVKVVITDENGEFSEYEFDIIVNQQEEIISVEPPDEKVETSDPSDIIVLEPETPQPSFSQLPSFPSALLGSSLSSSVNSSWCTRNFKQICQSRGDPQHPDHLGEEQDPDSGLHLGPPRGQ